jgi:hypothetical protein
MRSRFALLPLAACFVFASVDNADARGGKGFRSLLGSSSSSDKAASSPSATSSRNPDRGGENGSQAASSNRGGDQRFAVYGTVGYRPPAQYDRNYYRTEPSSTAAAATVAAPASAAVVAALAPAASPAAAKPSAAETRPRVDTKKYRDPNSSDVCPPPAYVFDDMNGCRPKGSQVSNLR